MCSFKTAVDSKYLEGFLHSIRVLLKGLILGDDLKACVGPQEWTGAFKGACGWNNDQGELDLDSS